MTGLRMHFTTEMDQLRIQVELMAVRVDENLERAREVLLHGDPATAAAALAADDQIDAMHVSLMERCYDLLRREAPVAGDLRFVVSALRVLSELERVGDLALRCAKHAGDHGLLVAHPPTFDVLCAMADESVERFRTALRAWATLDLALAEEVSRVGRTMDVCYERLMDELLRLEGPEAARLAVAAFAVGRSFDRISDHSAVIGARLRYLITGDPDHLAAEVR